MGGNWQKYALFWFSSVVNSIFSKNTGWIPTTKISEDSLKFSEGDSEKYLCFCALLRSPDNKILPRIAELNGGIDFCEECLKTR